MRFTIGYICFAHVLRFMGSGFGRARSRAAAAALNSNPTQPNTLRPLSASEYNLTSNHLAGKQKSTGNPADINVQLSS
jgi:hypothetical protein